MRVGEGGQVTKHWVPSEVNDDFKDVSLGIKEDTTFNLPDEALHQGLIYPDEAWRHYGHRPYHSLKIGKRHLKFIQPSAIVDIDFFQVLQSLKC